MGRAAVDVVLLPDEQTTELLIEANQKLVKQGNNEIILNKESCLPHISLAMGCIDEGDLDEIGIILRDIAKTITFNKLFICGIYISVNNQGEKISSYIIVKNQPLQELHEAVIESMKPFFRYKATKEMVFGHQMEDIAIGTINWINDYPEKSSYENYFAHITIGYGQADAPDRAIEFGITQLGIYHLGNHCTCRKPLVEVKL
jgi:hypothetical protein